MSHTQTTMRISRRSMRAIRKCAGLSLSNLARLTPALKREAFYRIADDLRCDAEAQIALIAAALKLPVTTSIIGDPLPDRIPATEWERFEELRNGLEQVRADLDRWVLEDRAD